MIELTKDDIEKALKCAIRNIEHHGDGTSVRWGLVSDLTGHGSNYSIALCHWAGVNPDDQIEGECVTCEHAPCVSCSCPRGENAKERKFECEGCFECTVAEAVYGGSGE